MNKQELRKVKELALSAALVAGFTIYHFNLQEDLNKDYESGVPINRVSRSEFPSNVEGFFETRARQITIPDEYNSQNNFVAAHESAHALGYDGSPQGEY